MNLLHEKTLVSAMKGTEKNLYDNEMVGKSHG